MKKHLALTIIVSVVGILVVAGILYATVKVVYRDRKIENEINALKQQESAINTENKTLQDQIAFQQTPAAQELYAKQKLDMQNPDENVAVIKPGMTAVVDGAAQTNQPAPEAQPQPNFKKWWNYFFAYNQG